MAAFYWKIIHASEFNGKFQAQIIVGCVIARWNTPVGVFHGVVAFGWADFVTINLQTSLVTSSLRSTVGYEATDEGLEGFEYDDKGSRPPAAWERLLKLSLSALCSIITVLH